MLGKKSDEALEASIIILPSLLTRGDICYLEVENVSKLYTMTVKQLGGIHSTIKHNFEYLFGAQHLKYWGQVMRACPFKCQDVNQECLEPTILAHDTEVEEGELSSHFT